MEAIGGLPAPHGGQLIDRRLTGAARLDAISRGSQLRGRIRLDAVQRSDLELMAVGALSPLTGFMHEREYHSVLEGMRLESGLIWSLPVTLAVTAPEAESLRPDETIALEGDGGTLLGLMQVTDRFHRDRALEARRVFGTDESSHPGVQRLLEQGEVCLAGPIWVTDLPAPDFPAYHLEPAQTRQHFAERGWRTVVGFQTRNPVHRAHEYIQKCALEICDGLLLHPLVGETKADDIPAPLRMAAYQAVLEHYFPPDRAMLAVFPAAMRYAGPREAIWHAICRKNYGCSHFVVGRDHAGIGRFYGTYDAQRIFDQFAPAELEITPLCFEHTFFCRACGGMASSKTCPHGAAQRVTLSGTRVRELLAEGRLPPPEFTRPEVARALMERRSAILQIP